MKTKKLLLVVFAMMMAFSVAAQNGVGNQTGNGKGDCKKHKTPEERAKKQTEMMKQELQLSDAQTAEIEKINTKYALECEKMKQEMKEKRKAQSAIKNTELKKVLTPEQYTKLEKIRAEKKEQGKMKKQHMKKCMQESKTSQPQ